MAKSYRGSANYASSYIYTFSGALGEFLPGAQFTLRPSLAHSYIGSVTAWLSSSGHQAIFAALSRGHHLYSAGRPSRWASAHILVTIVPLMITWNKYIDCLQSFGVCIIKRHILSVVFCLYLNNCSLLTLMQSTNGKPLTVALHWRALLWE